MPYSRDFSKTIGVPLTAATISLNIFHKIKENSATYVVSEKVKKAVEQYVDTSGRKEALALWRELLIDAVCLLKVNDKREKVKSFAALNEGEFVQSLGEIRSISSFGIDELDKYFSDFVEFESVLYNDEYYRDHVHHVLQVWGVGVGLLFCDENSRVRLKLPEGLKLSPERFCHQNGQGNSSSEVDNSISVTELWAMWTIIALCHDLGYPLEKASKINQKVKKIVNHFGCFNFEELNFKFDLLNTFLIDKFLKVISSKTVESEEKLQKSKKFLGIFSASEEALPKTFHTEVQQKYYDKFSKSLEEYKHGMFSGLLIFKKLVYFLETDFGPCDCTLSPEDRRQFIIRREILRSICGHTCPKIYHIDLNTLSFLLILCDEIQEWSRPRFEELIGEGATKFEPEASIKEYTVGERTRIRVSIKYKFKSCDFREAAKACVINKYKTFIYLLRSAKSDSERNTFFEWESVFLDKVFRFCFDSAQEEPLQVKTQQKLFGTDDALYEKFDVYEGIDIFKQKE